MDYKKWFLKNTHSLKGKTVAVTGSTGGLGIELCKHLVELGANLVLLNRNDAKTQEQIAELKRDFTDLKVSFIPLDLSDMSSVKSAAEALNESCPDILIHNAGAYSIPRYITSAGVDNVFQINFLAPYYITRTLLPALSKKGGKVVAVGSIAHNYSKTNADNIDFASVKAASKVYGNAKRYLMLSLYELFKNEKNVGLSVVHPGITFTNITAHYPKVIFAVIKHPMKIIFMKPKKAALCILKGVFDDTPFAEWIGPWLFNVWGLPSKKKIKTFKSCESEFCFKTAEQLFCDLNNLKENENGKTHYSLEA